MSASTFTLRGHLDAANRVVLDDPVPAGLEAGQPVTIIVDVVAPEHDDPDDALAKILAMAFEAPDLPPDFAAQHEHYMKGTPRKP